jgi:hypothetical protein
MRTDKAQQSKSQWPGEDAGESRQLMSVTEVGTYVLKHVGQQGNGFEPGPC